MKLTKVASALISALVFLPLSSVSAPVCAAEDTWKTQYRAVLEEKKSNGFDAFDASSALAAYAKTSSNQLSGLSEVQTNAADVNEDGIVDARDASNILAYYAYTSTNGKKELLDFLKTGR